MRDLRRAAVTRAIAGDVDPTRLPGLEATVDRVMDALEPAGALRADDHARRADELLSSVERLERELVELDEHKRLELAVSGNIRALNEDVRHSVQSAQAHALTAIALTLVERMPDAP